MLVNYKIKEILKVEMSKDKFCCGLNSKFFSINLRSKTREGILEHASYLMRSPAVKCLCRWWPSEDDSEDEEKVETEEFVLANLLGDSLFADGMDGDDY